MNNKIYNSMTKKDNESKDLYKIIFTTSDGKDIEYEIILTFKSNKKIYYIMTDNTRYNNKLNITAFYINIDNDETFYPVVDDAEFKTVMEVFNTYKANFRGNING